MSKIQIENNIVHTESLSLEGKINVSLLQLVESYIAETRSKIAACEMAHDMCVDFIKNELKL